MANFDTHKSALTIYNRTDRSLILSFRLFEVNTNPPYDKDNVTLKPRTKTTIESIDPILAQFTENDKSLYIWVIQIDSAGEKHSKNITHPNQILSGADLYLTGKIRFLTADKAISEVIPTYKL